MRQFSSRAPRPAGGRWTAAILAALSLCALSCHGCGARQNGAGGTTGGAGISGAGGTAGGAGGSGAVDGGADADCVNALYCDNFESYPVGPPPGGSWTAQTNTATIAIDTGEHHSGSKAVRFTTPGTADFQSAFIVLGSIFPVTGNAFYGRMMILLEAAPTASVHWTMIQGSGLVPGETYHAQVRYGGQLPIAAGSQLMANYDTPDSYSGSGPSSDCWAHADGTVVPVGVWSCVEWQFDGAANTMRFWLDKAPIDSLTVVGVGQGCVHQPSSYPWTAPTFDRLALGWESYQADDPRTFWIDDVILSMSKIGCPP